MDSNKQPQQTIKFLGTGDAFSEHPNNAYFRTADGTLVFIDMDTRNFTRAKQLITETSPRNICVLVTHMHNDHVSGIPTLAEWLYYQHWHPYMDSDSRNKGKKLHVCAPAMLLHNLNDELYRNRLINENMVAYNCVDVISRDADGEDVSIERKGKYMTVRAIPTVHVGGYFHDTCFGYYIELDGGSIVSKRIVYTGDTADLAPYAWIPCDELYCEISAAQGDWTPHLSWNDNKEKLFSMTDGKDIYLMHMDAWTRTCVRKEAEEHGIHFAAEADFGGTAE